jgi:chromate transporter
MTTAAPDTLLGLFLRFTRFGLLAWGGPVAQIAMIRRELVDEQQWVTPARFNRLLAVYQALPGPEAHELCVHFGMIRRGRLGGIAAGLGFMTPGLLLILGLAWAYRQLDLSQPPLPALFLGIQIAVVALIVRAVHRIGEHVLGDRWLWGIALGSAAAALAGISFWVLLGAGGLVYLFAGKGQFALVALVIVSAIVLAAATLAGSGPAGVAVAGGQSEASAGALLLSGLKAGLLTFGGAYTAIPFVRGDAVGRGWVSDGQFLDGLALSGIIPAPLIIFATFVGFQAGGLAGALAMTAGIFLPAFGFSLLFFERLERVVEDERVHRLLEGIAAAVVGLIAATAFDVARSVAGEVPALLPAVLIFAAVLALLYAWTSKYAVLGVLPLAAGAGLVAFG